MYEDIVYEKVGPSRGAERVLIAWDPPSAEGIPEHRDTVLSVEKKGENTMTMPFVSRTVGERLVLDRW